ncbi:anaerobic ribonucleoside-triphosphate reductase activating protein [Actinoplanes sp. NPDC049802]|uniref:anaerobic ribonucleoside-triphosphate reductase activating protein n=1 Tax=Actinoplanes sp. NPDC049802 TaxID=3154742 RepID=UPI0033C8BF87
MSLRIGGLSRLSTCDWPGRLVATVFCQGCPWTCRYCHNPQLIPGGTATTVSWDDVTELLRRRAGLLDGVVFSGGEPTMQAALLPAIHEVREIGFDVGLHTGGAHPRRLAALLPLVDWVGLDIKALPRLYPAVTGSAVAADRAWASLRLVLESGVAYEVRTTVDEGTDDDAVAEMAGLLARAGVRSYAIQRARPAAGDGPAPPLLADLHAQFGSFAYRPA